MGNDRDSGQRRSSLIDQLIKFHRSELKKKSILARNPFIYSNGSIIGRQVCMSAAKIYIKGGRAANNRSSQTNYSLILIYSSFLTAYLLFFSLI